MGAFRRNVMKFFMCVLAAIVLPIAIAACAAWYAASSFLAEFQAPGIGAWIGAIVIFCIVLNVVGVPLVKITTRLGMKVF